MIELCQEKDCTGCSACYNICPQQCIEMVKNEEGALVPNIDKRKCTNCQLCVKICPENNKVEFYNPLKVYASWSLDEKIRKNSSSGGLAYEIYKHILENGGVAFGTKFNEKMELEHTKATTLEQVKEFCGSKYVQSHIRKSYTEVKKCLKENKKVVFVGTPCQISGLKNFLKNTDTKDLLTIDLICHGVPPQKYLKDYIEWLHLSKKVDDISFRGKNNWNFTAYCKNEIIYKKQSKEDAYYRAFLEGLFYRENCYHCKYARKERVSDITLGDFWGLGQKVPFEYLTKEGVSVILVNTDKGNKVIEKLKTRIFIEERTIEEAVEGNAQLKQPSKKHKNTEEFKQLYMQQGFYKALEKSMKN